METDIVKKIEDLGVVPVVVINDAEKSEDLAKALIDGNLPCAEVTFRTEAAEEAIKRMTEAYPELIIGAGTIVTVSQAEKAVKAGAKFLVSPGYDQVLVDWTKKNNIVYIPGVLTPSEVQVAVANGFSVLKFFPAEVGGGIKMINNLCGPFPQVRFMATGGISSANLRDYGQNKHIAAVGGSWMVKLDLVENGNWTEISKLCAEAISIFKQSR